MSQAEALLASLAANTHEHSHPVPDTDASFVIDPYSRLIENGSYLKNVIMQRDHNSERFTFEIPRYVDGHDMALCNRVIVHFDNISTDGTSINSDVAYMTDLEINPKNEETVISSWLITREATQIVGILSFSIQYLCVEEDGTISYEWSTDSFEEIEVRKSKNNGEASVVRYSNVLEQWRTELFGAGDSVMANITSEGESRVAAITAEGENQLASIAAEGTSHVSAITTEGESQLASITSEGRSQVASVKEVSAAEQEAIELKGSETLASIPEDYTEVYNMASEAVRTKADGVVCEAECEVITINDTSDDYIRGLNLYGKSSQFSTTGAQLLNYDAWKHVYIYRGTAVLENNGITLTATDDDCFTVHGEGNFPSAAKIPISEGETITISWEETSNTVGLIYIFPNGESAGMVNVSNSLVKQISYTATAGITYVTFRFGVQNAGNTIAYKNIMINKGSTILPYEPYTGGAPSPNPEYPQEIESLENPTVTVCGKNLLNIHATPATLLYATAEVDGETVTVSSTDDAILSRAVYKINYPKNVPLTISFDATILALPSLDVGSTVRLRKGNKSTGIVMLDLTQIGVKKHYEITSDPLTEDDFEFWLYLRTVSEAAGYVSVKFENIQVEVGEVATEYEPYKSAQSIALAHTLPGISVSSDGNYTDSDGQQWICDEVDFERGVYIKRIGTTVFDETGNYHINSYRFEREGVYVFGSTSDHVSISDMPVISDKLRFNKWSAWNIETQNNLVCYTGYAFYFYLADATIQTPDAFKAYVTENPITVQYILATPIETPLTAEEIETYKSLKTNYPNTTVLNDTNAMMKVKYNADTKLYINNAAVNGAANVVEEVLNGVY